MNSKDAIITFNGLDFISGATTDSLSISSDSGNLTITTTSAGLDDEKPSFSVGYIYQQLLAPEKLILKMTFDDSFPKQALFEIKSTQFSGFNVNKQEVDTVELNTQAKETFTTGISLSVWLCSAQLPAFTSIQLKFFKVVGGDGGIEKQIQIAETDLKFNING